MGHEERAHALLSASGAHRWITCPASALLEQQFPDTTSDAAREGTLAHELAELKLRNYFYTTDFGKRKLTNAIKKLKENDLWQDEMMGYTDTYLDYVKSAALGFAVSPYAAIEKRVDFSAYVPDGFGTADCVLISSSTMRVVDFKYGKGVSVSAEMNPQLMLYALGAYEAYRFLYPVEQIILTIVQPRIPDGISEWSCSLKRLLKFGDYIKERAAIALQEKEEFHPEEEACRFCRARSQCRARAEENTRLAFQTSKKPPLISDAEVGKYLILGGDVARWLGDLKDYALSACLAGKKIPGWKAVEGRGSREWGDLDKAFAALKSNGIPEEILWERKPLTVAQTEKVIGKKEFDSYVGSMILKKPGKPALVKEADKREPITNIVSAAHAFAAE